MQKQEVRLAEPSERDYQALVHRLYSGPRHEPVPDNWSQAQINRLLQGVTTDVRRQYGRALLAVEAGCPLHPMMDLYLSPKKERRDFLGYAILFKETPGSVEYPEGIAFDKWEKQQKSVAKDPSGAGILSDVYPENLRPWNTMLVLPREEIPSSKDKAVADMETRNERMHMHLRIKALSAVHVLKAKHEELSSIGVWKRLFSRDKIQLIDKLLVIAQEHLRQIDDVHAWADEPCATRGMGIYVPTPTWEEVEGYYKNLSVIIDELTRQVNAL
jgi:hypothetical protein